MSANFPVADARFEQLRRLTEISRALTYTTDLDEVLPLATLRAADLLDAKCGLLMLADDTGMLRVRATHGVAQEVVDGLGERLDETLIHRLQALLGAPMREAFLGVPLVVHGEVTGLLAVVRADGHLATDDDEWLLSAVADQVAVAVENARLTEELRRGAEASARFADAYPDDAQDHALATLSHDLRSPLNAIDSYAELIEMEILGAITDRQREALGRIRMSGRHLLAVLENVLEMTRLSAGVVRVRTRSAQAARVIDEALLMVQPVATGRRQTITTAANPDLIVVADADRLRQVLINLIGNAVKYTQRGGSIQVSAALSETDGRTWGTIRVADDGPGIPGDKLHAVFHPYYRIQAADGRDSEGSGLGLAISRELVRQMGGEIDVESQLGCGTVFTVRLPLAAPGDA
ncbi:MAG: HAMP domain-containing sensor histidine kinase [Gemmatimonadota bacterium]